MEIHTKHAKTTRRIKTGKDFFLLSVLVSSLSRSSVGPSDERSVRFMQNPLHARGKRREEIGKLAHNCKQSSLPPLSRLRRRQPASKGMTFAKCFQNQGSTFHLLLVLLWYAHDCRKLTNVRPRLIAMYREKEGEKEEEEV